VRRARHARLSTASLTPRVALRSNMYAIVQKEQLGLDK
jgi:hypothetical protein